MNNFNVVFGVVKTLCGSKGVMEEEDCLARVAHDANLPEDKVVFILSTLQDLELIKFSTTDHYIKLTSFGRKQEYLFTEK